ncbi:MCE family protein, partial [bacterium]|nr:MCE family protein [bacterium]
MKKFDNIRVYAWVEFVIWLIIIALCVFGIRYHNHKKQSQYKSYQIFMQDVDGLIVGSPVRFLGIQIGHVTKIQIVSSDLYVKFIITQKDLTLPTGSIATVEGSGLGGSKSLEIYPPKDNNSDKIIQAKDSTRLSKVMSLFNTIFKDFDEIFFNLDRATKEVSTWDELPKNFVIPGDGTEGLIKIDEKLDNIIEIDKNFKKQIQIFKQNSKGV